MKSMITMISFWIGALTFLGCQNSPIIDEPLPCIWNCDTFQPEIVWEMNLSFNDAFALSREPEFIDKQQVVFQNLFNNPAIVYRSFDRLTGQHIWDWAPEPESAGTAASWRENIFDEIYYDNLGKSLVSINKNGETNWTYPVPDWADPGFAVLGGRIYASFKPFSPQDTSLVLLSSNIDQPAWDTLFYFSLRQTKDGTMVNLLPPSLFVNSGGDSLLIFAIRTGHGAAPSNFNVQIKGFHLQKRQVLWEIEALPGDFNCSIDQPVIHEGIMAFPGHTHLYGIDLNKGQILYQLPFPDGLLTTDFLKVGTTVYFLDQPGRLYQVNIPDGRLLRRYPYEYGGNTSFMAYFEHLLYFTSTGDGRLYAVDTRTGEKIWAERSPNRHVFGDASFIVSGVALDTVNRLLYTSDQVSAMCLRLP